MKQIIYEQYGDASQLKIIDAEKPVPGFGQILIKVKASAINPIDWKIRTGEMKLFTGSKFPKGVGFDFSGTVESVGKSALTLKVGDDVFGSIPGFKAGSLAEYISIDEKLVVKKPAGISFAQASALSMTGATALRILEDVAKIRSGSEILINGATGGVGMFLTQIAKRKGAIVTAVASARGMSILKEWGCDYVIDYSKENIRERGLCYDVVVDLSDKLPFQMAKRIMKDQSIYVNTIPTPLQIIGSKIFSPLTNKKNKALITIVKKSDLQSLASFAEQGLDIRISNTYPLESVVEGYSQAEKNSVIGKSVFVIY